jgi:putative ABC transport system permease protein
MNQVIADCRAGGVAVTSLMSGFAGFGLALAVVGVFAVMAYTVAQRTHEIGIRVALGAQRGDVLRTIVKKGIVLATSGVGIGLALATPLMWMRAPGNPEEVIPVTRQIAIFLVATFLIGFAALLASYIPARRATRVDPILALRHE